MHDDDRHIRFFDALVIGIAQAIAVLPGISRSGATISTSVLLGIDREEAARFSFLMVVPVIFGYMAKKAISADFGDFDGVLLSESGKRKFLKAYNEKLESTIKHKQLKRNVSYQRLVRLECYKLAKHLLGIEKYKPFVIWW